MKIVIVLIALFMLSTCSTDKSIERIADNSINFDHFNHLYKEVDFQGQTVGVVHIYSQYPTYEYAIEPNEGFTCVDDVARAVVLCSKYLQQNGSDPKLYGQMEKMLTFILQMQHTNGYFNNFIWSDGSINMTYITSVAELNWWSFRALWALESALPLVGSNGELATEIAQASEKLVTNLKRDLSISETTTVMVNGLELPTWLPQKYAADQAALLSLGLLKYYKRVQDDGIRQLIDAMARGIMLMQRGDSENYPYGAFLSWENLWHAWGNGQAYALLKIGQEFGDQKYIDSALMEVDHFYPYLLNNGFAEAIWIQKIGEGTFEEQKKNEYPQITYGLRPMVWATLEAYNYSANDKYIDLAKQLEGWLYGQNKALTPMYNAETGVCYDGITALDEVNKNSGAESTIESLLILLEVQKIK